MTLMIAQAPSTNSGSASAALSACAVEAWLWRTTLDAAVRWRTW
jgi:hypothetical protein